MRNILLGAALMMASSAQADTIATYRNAAANFSMTVEIASNGDIRARTAKRTYYFVGGKDYFVDRDDSGVIVMRVDDIATLMAEQFSKLGDPRSGSATQNLVRKGDASIGKWTGEAYYGQVADGRLSAKPVVVISREPALTQLGKALARQYAKSVGLLDKVTGRPRISNMYQILSSGAPISLAGAELESVTFEPIPKSEFDLPAPPASTDQIRKHEGFK